MPAKADDLREIFANSSPKELKGHQGKVHSVAWSCDGRRLASGSVDKTGKIWNMERNVRKVIGY